MGTGKPSSEPYVKKLGGKNRFSLLLAFVEGGAIDHDLLLSRHVRNGNLGSVGFSINFKFPDKLPLRPGEM